MKKTKLTRSLMAACSIVALTAVMYGCVHSSDGSVTVDVPPEPPGPPIADVAMEVTLGAAEQAALLAVLDMPGDSDTVTVAAGGSVTREGVVFSCMSDYDCTFTVTNNLGTIVASVSTQKLEDADDPMVMAEIPMRDDTFSVMNEGNHASIGGQITPLPGATAPRDTNPNWRPTELRGMGIGEAGVLNADMAGLRSVMDPNGAEALTMGSNMTGADHAIDPSDDMEGPPDDSWGMKTLFADWGDTAVDQGDGGFETGAIVVKNLEPGTPHPFDRKLADRYVNMVAHGMFDLTIRADGTPPGVTTLATSVNINPTGTAATSTQWSNMVFDSDSLVGAQDQDLLIDEDETFAGDYFGAPGKFQCLVVASATGCRLARNDDGTVGVHDTDPDSDVVASFGNWSFTPDPGAMIEVPDQDWMAYGAWLTTPDNAAGEHRFGVFFNGMDPYAPIADSFDATNAAGLRGSATYSGGATGVYRDGDSSGLFTARAMLTADFDKGTDGMDDDVDYMISGRIDNFRDTAGYFLGDDTAESPNDPDAGGENDWVVLLNVEDFGGATQDGTANLALDGTTGGSADGVPWDGLWNGMFFGPGMNADDDAIPPSGVAGRFFAHTGDPDGPTVGTPPNATGTMTDNDAVTTVAGAFGATMDMDDDN